MKKFLPLQRHLYPCDHIKLFAGTASKRDNLSRQDAAFTRKWGKNVVAGLILLTTLIILGGCGSKPVPDWKNVSFNHMKHFKRCFLSGEERKADIFFDKAIDEIKKSGKLDILAKAYLTKCALRAAMLEEIECCEFITIEKVKSNRENENYYSFLTGNLDSVDRQILPPRYRNFLTALKNSKIDKINDEISGIEDPLSRLIATGISVKNNQYNEYTLKIALSVASNNGWKKPLLIYLGKLKSSYERNKEIEKAKKVQQKINLIKNDERKAE